MAMRRVQTNTGGGACLDGSAPTLYYAPAQSADTNGSWLLFLQGGGWCVDAEACWFRSNTAAGSTVTRGEAASVSIGGLLSGDASVNPDFHGFHRALLRACDGSSFTSSPQAGVRAGGLQHDGRRVLWALLHTLMRLGLRHATDVLWGGHSAGGLAATLYADHVHDWLAARNHHLDTFKLLSVSGHFVQSEGGCSLQPKGRPDPWGCPWLRAVHALVALHRTSPSLEELAPACIRSKRQAEKWRCFFANESAASVQVPAFLLSSGLDSWQLMNIWRIDGACWRSGFVSCTQPELARFNSFYQKFVSETNVWTNRPGNGRFIHSCLEHGAALEDRPFSGIAVAGVSMREAIGQWWRSRSASIAPLGSHTHVQSVALRTIHGKAVQTANSNPTCTGLQHRTGFRPEWWFENTGVIASSNSTTTTFRRKPNGPLYTYTQPLAFRVSPKARSGAKANTLPGMRRAAGRCTSPYVCAPLRLV